MIRARWTLVLFTLLVLCCISPIACRSIRSSNSKTTKSKSFLRSAKAKEKAKAVTAKQYITTSFCKSFIAECYTVALAGKTGNVQVVHQCQRNGGKSSSSYTFGCKANSIDITTTVLKSLVNSNTVAPAVISVAVAAAASTTATTTTLPQSVATMIITIALATETVTVDTQETTTSVLFENEVLEVALSASSSSPSKRSKNVAASLFCSAFTFGCNSQCLLSKTKSRSILCQSTSINNYSLKCQCTNGKLVTQHALYAAASQANKQVAAVSTSTQVSTHLVTATPRPTTKHITQEVTSTVSETVTTGTSTTQIVLAATGAVEMRSSDDSSSAYVYMANANQQLYSYTTDKASAIQFMAVQDESSGLYQLQLTDGSGQVFIAESGNSGDDYSSNSTAYSWTYSGNPSICGDAGTTAGTPDGAGSYSSQPCETFIFGKDVDAETLTNKQTVDMTMQWFNPDDYFPNQYSWIVLDGYNYLISASNPTDFTQAYVSNQVVSLRFPA